MVANNAVQSLNRKIKILVIDDDVNFLLGISRILLKADFEVISAPDGLHGIQKAQSDLPDLILLDINMPKMTGFQIKMILNRFPVTMLIPVVFVSALSDRATLLKGLNVAEDFIVKPVDVDVLIARIMTILRRVSLGYNQAVRDINSDGFHIEKIQEWGQSVEMYDSGTAGHTLRVTRWAVALARSLGISEIELENIRKGAMLHDIGKLAIPDSLLNKPGSLTPEEWIIMREHPNYGYELLLPLNFLGPVLDIPHFHHERWDGTGYPNKLKGEMIPLSARIFCVVDVYDAMLSKRPYKASMSENEVKEIIRYQSGKQFDPTITEHFLTNFDSIKHEVEEENGKENSGN